MRSETLKNSILLAVGAAFAALIVLLLPNMYFKGDLDAFWKWSAYWNQNWRFLYVECPNCNYPFVGMLLSAGLMGKLRYAGLNYESAALTYRLIMAAVDGVNVLLVYWILRRLAVPYAAALAALIGISVSSWAGGAAWGQIDDVGQLFILLALAWVVTKNTAARPPARLYPLYLAGLPILLGLLLLTKQLTIFSGPAFILIIIADAWFQTRAWRPFLLNMLLSAALLALVLFGFDLLIRNVAHFHSHLLFVWHLGTNMPDVIAANGFNVWVLLGRDIWSSAHVPVLDSLPFTEPYRLGEVLFVLVMAVVTLSLVLFVWEQFKRGERPLNRELLLNFILYLAWSNLCFNIFLTGTHERYLYHFYPYIIIAWMGLGAFNKSFSPRFLAVLLVCATLYGLFVLQIMNGISIPPAVGDQMGTFSHDFLAALHLALGVYLFIVILRYQQFLPNLRQLFPRKA